MSQSSGEHGMVEARKSLMREKGKRAEKRAEKSVHWKCDLDDEVWDAKPLADNMRSLAINCVYVSRRGWGFTRLSGSDHDGDAAMLTFDELAVHLVPWRTCASNLHPLHPKCKRCHTTPHSATSSRDQPPPQEKARPPENHRVYKRIAGLSPGIEYVVTCPDPRRTSPSKRPRNSATRLTLLGAKSCESWETLNQLLLSMGTAGPRAHIHGLHSVFF